MTFNMFLIQSELDFVCSYQMQHCVYNCDRFIYTQGHGRIASLFTEYCSKVTQQWPHLGLCWKKTGNTSGKYRLVKIFHMVLALLSNWYCQHAFPQCNEILSRLKFLPLLKHLWFSFHNTDLRSAWIWSRVMTFRATESFCMFNCAWNHPVCGHWALKLLLRWHTAQATPPV